MYHPEKWRCEWLLVSAAQGNIYIVQKHCKRARSCVPAQFTLSRLGKDDVDIFLCNRDQTNESVSYEKEEAYFVF